MDEIYKRLFDEYYHRLYIYALSIVHDADDAKDIVQSSFIKLWQKKNSINLSESGKAYLFTTVYHSSLNKIRNDKQRNVIIKSVIDPGISTKHNLLEDKELRIRIHETINQLPPRCLEVFKKSRYDGKKYAEIAEEMNISIKTVEVQVGKALKFLREKLSDLAMLLFCINL